MTIKSIIRGLSDENRQRLMHAFENDFEQWVEYEPQKFIGVNLNQQNVLNLSIEQTAGQWSSGEIK